MCLLVRPVSSIKGVSTRLVVHDGSLHYQSNIMCYWSIIYDFLRMVNKTVNFKEVINSQPTLPVLQKDSLTGFIDVHYKRLFSFV